MSTQLQTSYNSNIAIPFDQKFEIVNDEIYSFGKKYKFNDINTFSINTQFDKAVFTPDGKQGFIYGSGQSPIYHIYRNDSDFKYYVGKFGSVVTDPNDGSEITFSHPMASFFGDYNNDPTEKLYGSMQYLANNEEIEGVFISSSGNHLIISLKNISTDAYRYECWNKDSGLNWTQYKDVTGSKVVSCNHNHNNILIGDYNGSQFTFKKVLNKNFDAPININLVNPNLTLVNTYDLGLLTSDTIFADDEHHYWNPPGIFNGKRYTHSTSNQNLTNKDSYYWSHDGKVYATLDRTAGEITFTFSNGDTVSLNNSNFSEVDITTAFQIFFNYNYLGIYVMGGLYLYELTFTPAYEITPSNDIILQSNSGGDSGGSGDSGGDSGDSGQTVIKGKFVGNFDFGTF